MTLNEILTEMNRLYLDNRHNLDGKCFIVGKDVHISLSLHNIFNYLNIGVVRSEKLDSWALTIGDTMAEIAP